MNDEYLVHDLRLTQDSLSKQISDEALESQQTFEPCEIQDALVFGFEGLVIQKNGTIHPNSVLYPKWITDLWDGSPYRATAFAIHSRHRRPGTYLFLDGLWSEYFWHFLIEHLPRAIEARDSGYNGYYVLGSHQPAFCAEALELLKIPPEQILTRPKGHHWWVENVVLPPPSTGTPNHGRPSLAGSPEALRRIRNALLENLPRNLNDPIPGIYISRADASRGRHILNENELVPELESRGIRPLRLETLSLREQISLTSRAKILIGAHGAGLVHALFMPERSHIIEISVPGLEKDTNTPIHSLLKHRFQLLYGESAEIPPVHASNFTVSLDVMKSALNRLFF